MKLKYDAPVSNVAFNCNLRHYITGDQRCYKIEVYNSVIEFDGTASASAPSLSAAVPYSQGLTVSAWVRPDCSMSGGANGRHAQVRIDRVGCTMRGCGTS